MGKKGSWGLNPQCLGPGSVTASWGSSGNTSAMLLALLLPPPSSRFGQGREEEELIPLGPWGQADHLGQRRAFLHTYLEGWQRCLWLPPSLPASCPRRAALARACSAQARPDPAQRHQARSLPPLAPAGRGVSVAGGARASQGPTEKASSMVRWDGGHGACLCRENRERTTCWGLCLVLLGDGGFGGQAGCWLVSSVP